MLLCSHSIAGKFPYPPKREQPMSEAKPQDGSTVKGYRELSFGEIGKMNQFKDLSRQFIKLLREHVGDVQRTPHDWE
ncbi:MAG: hypothetical protein E6736_26085, partial [Leclercia adecarboxylata]|nr:hypothetical protein [Leclercia adecarboxylata]